MTDESSASRDALSFTSGSLLMREELIVAPLTCVWAMGRPRDGAAARRAHR